mgnify:CR=1 FL=1
MVPAWQVRARTHVRTPAGHTVVTSIPSQGRHPNGNPLVSVLSAFGAFCCLVYTHHFQPPGGRPLNIRKRILVYKPHLTMCTILDGVTNTLLHCHMQDIQLHSRTQEAGLLWGLISFLGFRHSLLLQRRPITNSTDTFPSPRADRPP